MESHPARTEVKDADVRRPRRPFGVSDGGESSEIWGERDGSTTVEIHSARSKLLITQQVGSKYPLGDGVTIAATEAAEDIVARLEAESEEEDHALEALKEHNRHGHVPNRD